MYNIILFIILKVFKWLAVSEFIEFKSVIEIIFNTNIINENIDKLFNVLV